MSKPFRQLVTDDLLTREGCVGLLQLERLTEHLHSRSLGHVLQGLGVRDIALLSIPHLEMLNRLLEVVHVLDILLVVGVLSGRHGW